MKGVVFTEFLDFVGKTFGEDTVEEIIDKSDLESGGIYTAVGFYNYQEIVELVTQLAKHTNKPVPELLQAFGRALLETFISSYPSFFQQSENLFKFLNSIDHQIHVEVKKLYPDAELPKFETLEFSDNHIVMNYRSCRAMGALAEGLIAGAADYYDTEVDVKITTLGDQSGKEIQFEISSQNSSSKNVA